MNRALFICFLLSSLVASATESLPIGWDSVNIRLGKRSSAQLSIRGERLAEVRFQLAGLEFRVPATEFSAVPNPQLETVRVLYETGGTYIIQIRYGAERFERFPIASFIFRSKGGYDRLTFEVPTSGDSSYITEKFPGKPRSKMRKIAIP